MSTRQSKKTTVTSTSYSSAGESSSSSSSRRSAGSASASATIRPPSPARLSRMQEQEELQGLNDRLAAYIDRVRSLELENSRLTHQVRSTEEVVRKEVTGVKTIYECELAELRKLLDETAKEKARLQIEANKYRAEYDELLGKYNKRDREASGLERRVQVLERQLAEFNTREWEKETQSLRADLAKLEKQLATAKKQLEDETLLRVDLENRIKTLKEDLHFKTQVHEQELEESRVRTTVQMEEVDGRIEQEYEARLQDALQEIRAQHDYDLQSVKVELQALYETKITDLREGSERANASSRSAWDELMVSRKQVDDLNGELGKIKAAHGGWEERIRDLELQLENERDSFRRRLQQRDEELITLRRQLEHLEMEHAALLEIKIKLDREIEAYRKLLESEETRLNLSQMERSTISMSSSSGAKKRRRVDIGQAVEEYSQRSASSGYSRSASSSCGIDIAEVDTDGQFIKLENSSDKDISLYHWSVKHISGDEETVHKFTSKNVIKAGASVTLWSSDSSTTHSPPHDLVMKNKRWFVSGDMSTALVDDKDNEVATCSMTKNIRSVTSYSSRRSGLRDADDMELRDKDKCSVM